MAATRAFTVSSPSVGGQSMTMWSKMSRTDSSLSFNRKCASISPTSFASSLASAILAGAIARCSSGDATMTSLKVQQGSDSASYTLRSIPRTSMNDIVELAWGSRSISRVRLRRSASAAPRLMAVVVLPTPPFWLAMATIIDLENSVVGRRAYSRNG